MPGWTFEVRAGEVHPNDRGAAQLDPGWYAQQQQDADSGLIAGPFPTEAQALAMLLGCGT